jgi:hypothetical protein
MFENDYILRQIENLTAFLGKVIFHKERTIEIIDGQGGISASGLLYHRLTGMIADRKLNEAEDLLFEALEQEPTAQNAEVAVQFYRDLQGLSDETLNRVSFPREEILDGMEAVKKLFLDAQHGGTVSL